MEQDPYRNHNMREVWAYIKKYGNRFHTARMTEAEDGRDALDVYPLDSESESEVINELENEFDYIEHVESDKKWIRFAPHE